MAGTSIGEAVTVGREHHQAGRITQAATIYQQVLTVDGTQPHALNLLGAALAQQGHYDAAADLFLRGEASHPADPIFAGNRAVTLLLAGRPADAAQAARVALDTNRFYAPAHAAMARALAALGDRGMAEAHQDTALSLLPPGPGTADHLDGLQLDVRFRNYAYLASCRGSEARVILGGHWCTNTGWLSLDYEDQDITKPLLFPDACLDVVFTEHVIEHVPVAGACGFFQEALRVLKPGGRLRIACPMLERLVEMASNPEGIPKYLAFLRAGYFPSEFAALENWLGPNLDPYFHTFLMNSVYTRHGHQFIWSARLLADLLPRMGFSSAAAFRPGQGPRPDYCLEKGMHIVPRISDPAAAEQFARNYRFDPETLVVEAVK